MPDSDRSSASTSLVVAPPTPRRQVFFSQLPPKHRSNFRHRRTSSTENCQPLCLTLCAWTCLALFALVLLALVLAALLAIFLNACLPAIAVRSFKFAKLEVRNSALTASVGFLVEFANDNERLELAFGPLAVEASTGQVGLGKSEISAFLQRPRNATEVRVGTSLWRVGVDGDDAAGLADELKGEADSEAVAVEVSLRGTLGFKCRKMEIEGVPVLISCSVKGEIGRSSKSPCNLRIFPV